MEHVYKSYTILIITWASLERSGYTPEVRISRKVPVVAQTLKPNKAFPNKEEVENFAPGSRQDVD
jgi:hypothetical protein